MILPALVALPVAIGPLLLGCRDLWAQSLIHMAVATGTALWLLSRAFVGYLPLPSTRNLVWTTALIALGTACLWSGEAGGASSFYAFLSALWIFLIIGAISKDERIAVDQAVRVSAWILMLLVFYERLIWGAGAPSGAFPSSAAYAGAALMLAPLALERRDYLLFSGLLLSLAWSGGLGAWAGLFGAMLITCRRNAALSWTGTVGLLICLVALYWSFQSPDAVHHWRWWGAAAGMIADNPLFGVGPGGYGQTLPGYLGEGGALSAYAHQYFLQTAAEYGLPFAFLWFGGAVFCLMRGSPYKRFGAAAVLIQSLWDWSLAVPSNLWLFAYLAASSIPETSRGVNIASGRKAPAAGLIALAGWAACAGILTQWTGP